MVACEKMYDMKLLSSLVVWQIWLKSTIHTSLVQTTATSLGLLLSLLRSLLWMFSPLAMLPGRKLSALLSTFRWALQSYFKPYLMLLIAGQCLSVWGPYCWVEWTTKAGPRDIEYLGCVNPAQDTKSWVSQNIPSYIGHSCKYFLLQLNMTHCQYLAHF